MSETDLRDIIHELRTAKRARFETATPVTGTQSTCTQVNTMNAPPASHVAQPSGAPTSAATFSATSYSDALPMRYSDVQAAQSQSPEFTTPLVNQAHCEQGSPKHVWVVGSSIVRNAFMHAWMSDPNLKMESCKLWWQGYGGLGIKEMERKINLLKRVNMCQPPAMIIMHCGGNDIGRIKISEFIKHFKMLVDNIGNILPGTIVVFSQILPRLTWRYSKNNIAMYNAKRRLNSF
ncbi:uncharacterized protein LOC128224375 [Mya arenaria]|uniref:uncharacterized protein LOC128224375 n=1 Tax=Mya arenaria TaxID=6604 RepID=UPI0022E15FF9|nr:uncharacterized protein LOC128224375 [Mya arenaria]